MVTNTCLQCKKIFEGRPTRKYCSLSCYHESTKGFIPWNKGLSYENEKNRTGKYVSCKVCGKKKYFQLNQFLKRPCLYCSNKCYQKDSRKVAQNMAYSSIHARITRDWGRADKCDNCGSVKAVDWANKNGKYSLERNDWFKLCRKCHIKYDKENNSNAYLNYKYR